MAVYVDDFRAPYGRMKMCHMLADTDHELHEMAAKIGIARRWFQDTISGPHYDISAGKALAAIRLGAKPVTVRQMAMMAKNRRATGQLGAPDPYYGTNYDPTAPKPGAGHG